MIKKELQHLAVPIDSLAPHPSNARQGDIGAVAESLTAHGQYQPIIVQKSTGYIVAGNHRWKAAKMLGWTEIAAVVYDIDDEQATKLLLVDNRTSDLATYDHEALLKLMGSLKDLDGTGYDFDDMEDVMARVDEFDVPLSLSLQVTIQMETEAQMRSWEKFRNRDPGTHVQRLIKLIRSAK